MNNTERSHLAVIRAYLSALGDGVVSEPLAAYFTADAQQLELPNRLNPQGGSSDLQTMLRRSQQGAQLLQHQRYEIRSEMAQDDRAAIEAHWHATLAIPVGGLAAGAEMSAHFAMFFEFKDGRIHRQRNYDCFEPW